MTTESKFISMLVNYGMFESQAAKVMEIAKPIIDETMPGYKFTWDSPASEYPDVLFDVVFLSIKPIALKWIEENLPQAWFKAMFI